MAQNNVSANRETHAIAFELIFPMQAFEGTKDSFLVLVTESNSVVLYTDFPHAFLQIATAYGDPWNLGILTILEGIGNQILKKLLNLAGVYFQHWQIDDIDFCTGFVDEALLSLPGPR